jgi:hypothetical protein
MNQVNVEVLIEEKTPESNQEQIITDLKNVGLEIIDILWEIKTVLGIANYEVLDNLKEVRYVEEVQTDAVAVTIPNPVEYLSFF